jgi:hypothetical protein
MPYSTLPIVNPGDVLSASSWGNLIRTNEDYLFSGRPQATKHMSFTSLSTSSTSFVDVDAAVLVTAAITINSGRALVLWDIWASSPAVANSYIALDIIVDGATRLGDATYGLVSLGVNQSSYVTVLGLATGLSVGSHTFKLQAKSQGAAAVRVGNSDASGGNISRVVVWEL